MVKYRKPANGGSDLATRIRLPGDNIPVEPKAHRVAENTSLGGLIVLKSSKPKAASHKQKGALVQSRSTKVSKSFSTSRSSLSYSGPRQNQLFRPQKRSDYNQRPSYTSDDLIMGQRESPEYFTSSSQQELIPDYSTAPSQKQYPTVQVSYTPPQQSYTPSQGDLIIKGSGAPVLVVARNFVRGTTAADIETVLKAHGLEDGLLSCRVTASEPAVSAELGYSDFDLAQKVVQFFDNRRADGQLLSVYIPDMRTIGKPSAQQVQLTTPTAAPAPAVVEQQLSYNGNQENIPTAPRSYVSRRNNRRSNY